ncbi:MAG: hypothetical protein HZA91_06710 [Verrucomicrobia bacterium]|nr:hypothetical protein [Verrucomicrobiota bacterium]
MKPPVAEPDEPEERRPGDGRLELLKAYFSRPFPSREGFSAYRSPGAAVHGPILLGNLFLAAILCLPYPALWPFILVYLAAGLYGGRDVAVLCHYAPVLTLVVWALFFVLLVYGPRLFQALQTRPMLHLIVSVSASLIVLAVFAFHVWRTIRRGDE